METQEHAYSQKLHPNQSASSKQPFSMIVMTEDSNIMVLVIEDSNMIIDLIEDSKIMTEDSNIMILMIKDSNISICTVCATVFQICTRYVVIYPHHIFCPQCHLVLPQL